VSYSGTGHPAIDELHTEQDALREEREQIIRRTVELNESLKHVPKYGQQHFRLLEEKRKLADRQREIEGRQGQLKITIGQLIYRATKPRHEGLPDNAVATIQYAEQALTKVYEEFQILVRSKGEQNAITMAHMARGRLRKLLHELKGQVESNG
jgi:hypothetical protein